MAKAMMKGGKGGKPAAGRGGGGAERGGGGGGGGGEILVVGTKVKDVVKNAGCMSSSELLSAVSQKVHEMLVTAAQRAKENGRSTVRPHDL
jgi:hypothetical protein